MIGQGTSIGEKTTVKNTVLGRNCKIGKNVTLDGAYIWDGVVIGDNTTVHQAIVADGAAVGNNCKVESGALLSYGVKIADKITVGEGRRITKAPKEEDEGVPESDPGVVGAGGEGYEFFRDEDEEDEEDAASDASSGLGTLFDPPSLSISTNTMQSTTWPIYHSLLNQSLPCPLRYPILAVLAQEATAPQYQKRNRRTISSKTQRSVFTTAYGTV